MEQDYQLSLQPTGTTPLLEQLSGITVTPNTTNSSKIDQDEIRGRLIALTDRNGNSIQLEYVNAQPVGPVPVTDMQLYFRRSLIRDAYNRTITLTYVP